MYLYTFTQTARHTATHSHTHTNTHTHMHMLLKCWCHYLLCASLMALGVRRWCNPSARNQCLLTRATFCHQCHWATCARLPACRREHGSLTNIQKFRCAPAALSIYNTILERIAINRTRNDVCNGMHSCLKKIGPVVVLYYSARRPVPTV